MPVSKFHFFSINKTKIFLIVCLNVCGTHLWFCFVQCCVFSFLLILYSLNPVHLYSLIHHMTWGFSVCKSIKHPTHIELHTQGHVKKEHESFKASIQRGRCVLESHFTWKWHRWLTFPTAKSTHRLLHTCMISPQHPPHAHCSQFYSLCNHNTGKKRLSGIAEFTIAMILCPSVQSYFRGIIALAPQLFYSFFVTASNCEN